MVRRVSVQPTFIIIITLLYRTGVLNDAIVARRDHDHVLGTARDGLMLTAHKGGRADDNTSYITGR